MTVKSFAKINLGSKSSARGRTAITTCGRFSSPSPSRTSSLFETAPAGAILLDGDDPSVAWDETKPCPPGGPGSSRKRRGRTGSPDPREKGRPRRAGARRRPAPTPRRRSWRLNRVLGLRLDAAGPWRPRWPGGWGPMSLFPAKAGYAWERTSGTSDPLARHRPSSLPARLPAVPISTASIYAGVGPSLTSAGKVPVKLCVFWSLET